MLDLLLIIWFTVIAECAVFFVAQCFFIVYGARNVTLKFAIENKIK